MSAMDEHVILPAGVTKANIRAVDALGRNIAALELESGEYQFIIQ